MNGAEVKAIGRLEGEVKALVDRMDRSEAARAERHKAIYDRLGKLESAAQFNKGRMSWIGWLVTLIGLAVSDAVAALVTKLMSSG